LFFRRRAFARSSEKTFFIVEAVVAALIFSQPRRDALQAAAAGVFIDILGHNGSQLDREGGITSPAYLVRLHLDPNPPGGGGEPGPNLITPTSWNHSSFGSLTDPTRAPP
jgi:hypothetical protein